MFINFFLSSKKTTADIAKKRLQIIVEKRRIDDSHLYYLPKMKCDLVEVISKYAKIDPNMLSIQLKEKDRNTSILELSVILPKIEKPTN